MSNEMTTEDIFEQYKSMIEGVLLEGKSILTDEMIEADQGLFNEAPPTCPHFLYSVLCESSVST